MDTKYLAREALILHTKNPANLQKSHGGVSRNIAENLANLGVNCSFFTSVGDDENGREIIQHLIDIGVEVVPSYINDLPTPNYAAIINHDGSLMLALSNMDCADAYSPQFIAKNIDQAAKNSYWFCCSGLPEESVTWLAQNKPDHVKLLSVSASVPKVKRVKTALPNLFLLVLNSDELQALADFDCSSPEFLQRAAKKIIDQGTQNLIVTVGEQGAYWATVHHFEHIPTIKLNEADVVDVTGAGDAFASGVIAALLNDQTIREGIELGHQLAKPTLLTTSTVLPREKTV